MSVSASWVLSLMLVAQPTAPWRSTYDATAEAIAAEANAAPLADGPERTAALLVAVAWFESALRPDAAGDCTKDGRSVACTVSGSVAHSWCLMQIHETNHAGLSVTRAELQTDVRACVRAGLRMLTTSLRVCAAAPPRERLRWYAAGGGGCSASEDARRKSVHRIAFAERLLKEHQRTDP